MEKHKVLLIGLLIAVSAAGLQASIMEPDPLIALRMEENTGTTIANLGSLGSTVPVTSQVVWEAGGVAAAKPELQFTSPYNLYNPYHWVEAPQANFTTPAMSTLSFACWAMPVVASSEYKLFATGDGNSNAAGIEFMQTGSDAKVKVATTTGLMVMTVSNVFEIGIWHHYAFTYDSASGDAIFYCDGESVGTASWTGTVAEGTRNFALFDTYNNNPFYGKLDEIYVFNAALTENQVGNLMTYNTVPEPTTIALLMFGATALGCRKMRRK